MFKPLPVLDWVNDPRAYLAKVIQVFSEYPASIWSSAADKIQRREVRPPIKTIIEILDEAYEPFQREIERVRVRQIGANEAAKEQVELKERERRGDARWVAEKEEVSALRERGRQLRSSGTGA